MIAIFMLTKASIVNTSIPLILVVLPRTQIFKTLLTIPPYHAFKQPLVIDAIEKSLLNDAVG